MAIGAGAATGTAIVGPYSTVNNINIGGAFGSVTPNFSVMGTAAAMSLVKQGGGEPRLSLGANFNATPGSYTIVTSSASLGEISFQGSDGNNMEIGAKIQALVDGTPATNDMPTQLGFGTTDAGNNDTGNDMVLDSTGTFILQVLSTNVGQGGVDGAPVTGFTAGAVTPHLQVLGLDTNGSTIAAIRSGNNSGGPTLRFGKSRDANIDYSLISAADIIGFIEWQGSDDTDFNVAAQIQVIAAATPGNGADMPGDMLFLTTPDGSGTPAENFAIKSDGAILIGGPDAGVTGAGLHIDDELPLRFYEATGGGDHYKGFVSATSNAASTTCTFLNSTSFIPYSCLGSTQPTVTVDSATTAAITTSQITLACTGAETINTITGGVQGMRLLILHYDTDCTLADDDDATAADAIDLTGTATFDVGAVNKVIELVLD